MIIRQETYQITYTTKKIINALLHIYQNKKIQAFLNKLLAEED